MFLLMEDEDFKFRFNLVPIIFLSILLINEL